MIAMNNVNYARLETSTLIALIESEELQAFDYMLVYDIITDRAKHNRFDTTAFQFILQQLPEKEDEQITA